MNHPSLKGKVAVLENTVIDPANSTIDAFGDQAVASVANAVEACLYKDDCDGVACVLSSLYGLRLNSSGGLS